MRLRPPVISLRKIWCIWIEKRKLGRLMAHSPAASPPSFAPLSAKKTVPLRVLGFGRHWGAHRGADHAQQCSKSSISFRDRRSLVCGLTAAVLGLAGGDRASAAARRPSPPPPTEKQDPNVSGLQAKILASKRRKEAMEEAIGKLRARGKPINPPPAPPTATPNS